MDTAGKYDWHAAPKPDSKPATFGFVFAIVFGVISLIPLFKGNTAYPWAIALSTAFLSFATIHPPTLKPLAFLWLEFGLLLHRIVSPLFLGAMFFIGFTLTGWARRLFRADPMRLKSSPADSYWIPRTTPGAERTSMTKQF